MNREWLSFFITKHVDSNAVLSLNFVMFLRYRKFDVCIIQPYNKSFVIFLRDGPLFFIGGGGGGGVTIFGTCRQFFSESNAFQTIFFITFCNENNFFTTIFEKCYRLFIDLI